uniref:Uncharacterized protein n=1 Tax=Oryza punctata TaxID=4537 RepID=A0A0E0LKA0_ORYPU
MEKEQQAGHAKLPHEQQLVHASTELMNHSLGYLRSMALGCAAKLGVAGPSTAPAAVSPLTTCTPRCPSTRASSPSCAASCAC